MLRVRSVLLALVALLYVASWPGAALRPLVLERMAAPIPPEVSERDGVLDVVVTREADGEAIEGARVRAFAMLDGRAHAAGAARTDGEGRATLGELPRAEHWIVAEADGLARASQMVVVVSGARRLDLALGDEHRLDVAVVSEGGTPIPLAEIEVRGSDPFPVGARADAIGSARVGRLGEGPYTVVVRAPGYEEVVRRRVPEGERLVVTLSRQGALLVSVLSERGEPVSGARVLVASATLWPARVAETGHDGTVRIGGLDAGSYTLRAVSGSRVSPIEVAAAVEKGEETAVELRLTQGVMITARVVDGASTDPVHGARVTLAEGGLSPFPLEGVTDRKGRVVLGPIARGGATLSARADGFVQRGAVAVDDPPPAEVTLALSRGGTIVGRVLDSRGFPVDGATLRVIGTDLEGMPIDEDPRRTTFGEAHFRAALGGPKPLVPAGELGVVPGPVPAIPHGPEPGMAIAGGVGAAPGEPWITRRDGTFRAGPIPAGRVRVLVRHPQYVEAMSALVSLAADKEAHVDVVLLRGATLEGRVVDTRGYAVSGAHVTALATRGSLERMTRTGTDGSFAFASIPDALTLLVSRGEDVLAIAARLEVSVPDGEKKVVEITLPEPRDPLAVKVLAGRREPVDAAQISAVSLDTSEALRVTAFTDPRGEARLAGAKGLPLRIEVRAPGRATKVVITTREMASLTVELQTAERVTGEVWASRRETLEGADVLLHTETGAFRARTDKEGAFTIEGVSPGPARLRVRAEGRAPLEREVVISAKDGDKPTDLGRFELLEEGVVEGVVVDPRGDPVPGARVGKDAVPTYLPVGVETRGMAVAGADGRFRLGGLAEGTVTLEAYAPDVGRAHASVRITRGRTTDRVRIVLGRREPAPSEPVATGGVAITLGEAAADGEAEGREVVVVAVSEESEAERAGLLPNDVVVEVGGVRVRSIEAARARLNGPVHDDVVVKVRRGGRGLTLRIAREAVRR
jgi:hypothetical protein